MAGRAARRSACTNDGAQRGTRVRFTRTSPDRPSRSLEREVQTTTSDEEDGRARTTCMLDGRTRCATQLVTKLQERGYRCHWLPMTEFIKAGGACKCLTMFMPQREKA